MKISMKVNGVLHTHDIEPQLLLLDFIRDTLGLTGTKCGCETGQCGACTVLFNGVSVKSCTVLAVQAESSEITTIEGLAKNGQMTPLQEAFVEHHAVQDGYATPGEIMSLTDLLNRNPSPDESEIRSWLEGNLDRSTGYHNILCLYIHHQMNRLSTENQSLHDHHDAARS